MTTAGPQRRRLRRLAEQITTPRFTEFDAVWGDVVGCGRVRLRPPRGGTPLRQPPPLPGRRAEPVATGGATPRKQPAPPWSPPPMGETVEAAALRAGMVQVMPDTRAFTLTAEQQYEFDVKGYFVLRGHYGPESVARFHAGIDELQAIPLEYDTYKRLGIASFALAAAMEDPEHEVWDGSLQEEGPLRRVDHMICGSDKFDEIIRDPVLKALHQTLAGGNCYMSSTYYIEKRGPAPGGGMHNAGYPKDRHFHYEYDRTFDRFLCSSTRSVVILSDMTTIESGPFACIPGSHKANFQCPFPLADATDNPMAVPVFAAPGDVLIFTEGMTHNAFPVTNDSIRRSLFFNYSPALDRDNLPSQRMSIYPDHVLSRLADQNDLLTVAGYV